MNLSRRWKRRNHAPTAIAKSEFCFFNGASETVVKFFKIYTDSEVSLLIFFRYFSRSSSRISFLIFSRSYFSAAASDCFCPYFEAKSERTDSFSWKHFSNSCRMILNSASETLLSTRAFETRSLTVSRFAVASAKIFSCFKTLVSRFLLAAVKLADEKPSREAKPAREAPTGIPIPVSVVASPAEESKAHMRSFAAQKNYAN